MNEKMDSKSLFKQPSAWIPLVMSLAALSFLMGYVAVVGIAHNAHTADEAAPARVFQVIMLAQLPIAGYFAIKWLPRQPKQSMLVLAAQAAAWIIPIAAVLWMESL